MIQEKFPIWITISEVRENEKRRRRIITLLRYQLTLHWNGGNESVVFFFLVKLWLFLRCFPVFIFCWCDCYFGLVALEVVSFVVVFVPAPGSEDRLFDGSVSESSVLHKQSPIKFFIYQSQMRLVLVDLSRRLYLHLFS